MSTQNEVTTRSLIGFINAMEDYLSAPSVMPDGKFHPGTTYRDPEGKTKLGYANRRVKPQAVKHYQGYMRDLEYAAVDNCLTEGEDGKGKVLSHKSADGQTDEYDFDRDGRKRYLVKQQELLEKKVKIDPYYATAIPDNLPARLYDAMIGFVIDPKTFDELEKVVEKTTEDTTTKSESTETPK